jgi:hypothetical protein
MTKRIVLCIAFSIFCIGVIMGQESGKNTISGGINLTDFILPGFSIGYERLLHKNFAISADIGIHSVLIPYADIHGRWYPWAGMFFVDIGMGIWVFLPLEDGDGSAYTFPVISPGIGWKIDIGQPNGFVLIAGIEERISFTPFDVTLFFTKINLGVGYNF